MWLYARVRRTCLRSSTAWLITIPIPKMEQFVELIRLTRNFYWDKITVVFVYIFNKHLSFVEYSKRTAAATHYITYWWRNNSTVQLFTSHTVQYTAVTIFLFRLRERCSIWTPNCKYGRGEWPFRMTYADEWITIQMAFVGMVFWQDVNGSSAIGFHLKVKKADTRNEKDEKMERETSNVSPNHWMPMPRNRAFVHSTWAQIG